ncbi:MAG: cysteine--1-D-myo-inosityl 2-amino-2-deoxy-alpha-D-glucopyranoside ligase [Mycobacteriales bacterium]
MRSWAPPTGRRTDAVDGVPQLPGQGPLPQLYDSVRRAVAATAPGPIATMYVCGITPYDATHLGHANTYLAFDLVNRAWRDAGRTVRFVQNVTDVDEPLLERAERDGIDWRELAAREIELYRTDMAFLRMLPPDTFAGAVESIPSIAESVGRMVAAGATYTVEEDVYFSVDSDPHFGYVSSLDSETMRQLSADNGGDPDRPGKKNPLDPVLWRARRGGEPSWVTPIGAGRPGWHIECASIAVDTLGPSIDVQGGGRDLIYPHHEMSAAHAEAMTSQWPFARHYVHSGLMALDGEKMSKSLGNLVFVHRLRERGTGAAALRLALLDTHYRVDRSWSDAALGTAAARLDCWRRAVSVEAAPDARPVLDGVRAAIADDLDTPGALAVVDAWAGSALGAGGTPSQGAGELVVDVVDALLGVAL